jgi:hypothetical protein
MRGSASCGHLQARFGAKWERGGKRSVMARLGGRGRGGKRLRDGLGDELRRGTGEELACGIGYGGHSVRVG